MPEVVVVRVIWDRTGVPLEVPGVRLHALNFGPEPDHPFGRRGLALAAAWKQLANPAAAGMLMLDGDVVIDPHDMAMMLAAVDGEPRSVHTAPVKLWPASTTRAAWHWGHHRGIASQERCHDPLYFTFSFTYVPKRLITACIRAGLQSWTFPTVDTRVSQQAQKAGIPVRVVEDCTPKHLHF